MSKFLTILLSLMLFLQAYSQILAKTNELMPKGELQSLGFTEYESINPNLLIYQLKRLGEEVTLSFTFDKKSKNEYSLKLLDTRFKELIYIINFEKTGFLTESVNRYNVFVGKIKPYYKDIDSYDLDKIKKYIVVLEKLRDKYPANSAYWLSIQQSIDSTKNLI